MRPVRLGASVLTAALISASLVLSRTGSADGGTTVERRAAPSLAGREQLESNRICPHARTSLADSDADIFQDIATLEFPESGHVPNYLRAMAALPATVKPFAHLIRTVLYRGVIRPETKMIVGFCIGQINGSPYVTSYMERLLGASARGERTLDYVHSGDFDAMAEADRLAIRYALVLTGGVWGVDDEEFERLRRWFNEPQTIELTLTVGFFNYFTRFCEALDLPVEDQVESHPGPPKYEHRTPAARIRRPADEELDAAGDIAESIRGTQCGLGIGSANWIRAMARCPDLAEAWIAYQRSTGEYNRVSRALKFEIGFAVSMANDCRYCTLQQLLGLHRLGVDHGKLIALRKNDEALGLSEQVAVLFARKLTRKPSSITDKDYQELTAEFTSQGALEVLVETCAFALMNRFTDGLRLPSDDEAVRVYREVYGSDWTRQAQ